MTIKDTQKDMRLAYLGGGPGAIISGVVWIMAGLTALFFTPKTSILVFFFGGMFIHPLGILFSKFLKRTGKHHPDNPLAKLAMESTLLIFVGLFVAYTIFPIKPEWFFGIMLLLIGARYVIFQSIYGMKIYWIFGMTLLIIGWVCIATNQPFPNTALIGGATELIFAPFIFRSEKTFSNIAT